MKRLDKLAEYTLLGTLGKGGMGVVYIGFDEKQNRFAAIKVLSDQVSSDQMAVKRFKREGDLYAKINHPNVVTSYGAGQYHDQLYIALELVQGKALNDILAFERTQGQALPIIEALEIYRSLLSALQAAHQLGVVHRDMKPHNVIINPFGVTKLLDFGVAQVTDDDMNLTKTGLIIGTLLYASPEQNQGKAVDGRSDLYSLGVMLYEMLAGKRLFKGSNVGEIILQQIQCTTATVTDKVPGLPPQFDEYFRKLVHPMTSARFESAREALGQLDGLAKQLGPAGRQALYGRPVDELWFASRLHFVRGEYEKSEALARKCQEQGLQDPRVWLLLGRIARETKDEHKMVEAFTKVLQIAPADTAPRLEYVLALNAFGKPELAQKEIEGVLKVDPENAYATGLRDLFAHQVRWMTSDEVAQRKKAVLEELTLPAGREGSGGPSVAAAPVPTSAEDVAFVDKVVSAMRIEAARYEPAAVEAAAWRYPGAGLKAVGRGQEASLILLVCVLCAGAALFALVTGLDYNLPVNDLMMRISSEESMVQALDSRLEERVNEFFKSYRIIFVVGFVALLGLAVYGLWAKSVRRARVFARRKSLMGQVVKVLDGPVLELDFGSDRGAAAGQVFQLLRISRKGKAPAGVLSLTEVAPATCRAAYQAAPVPEGQEALRPQPGDVAVMV